MNSPARRAPQDPSVPEGPISNLDSAARERNPRGVIDEIAAAVEAQRKLHAEWMAKVAPGQPSVKTHPDFRIAPFDPQPSRVPQPEASPEAQASATQSQTSSNPEDK